MLLRKSLFFCFFLLIIFLFLLVTSCDQSKDLPDTPNPKENTMPANDKDEPTIRICDWYGKFFPICENILEGWGWENNESCIGIDSCENTGGISLDFSEDLGVDNN